MAQAHEKQAQEAQAQSVGFKNAKHDGVDGSKAARAGSKNTKCHGLYVWWLVWNRGCLKQSGLSVRMSSAAEGIDDPKTSWSNWPLQHLMPFKAAALTKRSNAHARYVAPFRDGTQSSDIELLLTIPSGVGPRMACVVNGKLCFP